MPQVLIKITGKVQGVFFRAHAKEQADALGLTGYAKNLPDCSVEVLVQGQEPAIKEFIKWCKEGSPSSSVEGVEVEEAEYSPPHDGFFTC